MSVCIALLCNNRRTIVTVTDRKVSFGNFSADGLVLKDIPFRQRTSVLVAGDDMEHEIPILDRAKELLGDAYKPPAVVADALDEAFRERVHRQIENSVLGKRGFTVPSFLDKGKQKCTSSAYLSLCSRIDQVSIKLKFLVCGFDAKDIGHLYLVDGENAPANYDSVGMWAIGSGAHAALSSLMYFAEKSSITVFSPAEVATYFGIVAKFMAESQDQVGKEIPFVCVVDSGQKPRYIAYERFDEIKKYWEDHGAPRVPPNLEAFMKPLIAPLTQSASQK
ncbi:MAG TPA: hypothetical protein VFQ00_12435 [Terriglobales bacterium]|nr:hypothetical protein [Terriglobales bacterium]